MGPRDVLVIMVLLIASERNPTQVRLGEIRALLEGIQRPQETDGSSPGQSFVSALCVSVIFSYYTLTSTCQEM